MNQYGVRQGAGRAGTLNGEAQAPPIAQNQIHQN